MFRANRHELSFQEAAILSRTRQLARPASHLVLLLFRASFELPSRGLGGICYTFPGDAAQATPIFVESQCNRAREIGRRNFGTESLGLILGLNPWAYCLRKEGLYEIHRIDPYLCLKLSCSLIARDRPREIPNPSQHRIRGHASNEPRPGSLGGTRRITGISLEWHGRSEFVSCNRYIDRRRSRG